MTTGCYEASLLLFANARGDGTLVTVKCPAPGTHRKKMPGVCRGGGMLAVGIDSHIMLMRQNINNGKKNAKRGKFLNFFCATPLLLSEIQTLKDP